MHGLIPSSASVFSLIARDLLLLIDTSVISVRPNSSTFSKILPKQNYNKYTIIVITYCSHLV